MTSPPPAPIAFGATEGASKPTEPLAPDVRSGGAHEHDLVPTGGTAHVDRFHLWPHLALTGHPPGYALHGR